jgi:diguanylate cyclase (GGDEF)-like protein
MIYSFQNACFRDKETGLYNEAYFMEMFHREWHRMIREHHALSVLVVHPNLDIMNPRGMEEYVTLAQILEQTTKRTTDLVSRFKDNEFIIGLFDLTPDGTTTIIERILDAIKQSPNGSLASAKHAFIGGLNVYPTQSVDISDVLEEVETITSMESRNRQPEQHYALKLHEVH